MGRRAVRVYQEDWHPFQNLPAALKAFEAETGIATELVWDKIGVGSIEAMFDAMTRSFTEAEPPFDLVCLDEVMLWRFADEGRVMPLDAWMRRDGVTLDAVMPGARRAAMRGGAVMGLPCVAVSNLLLYRRDLLERYGLPVPQDWDELRRVAEALQTAVRRDEGRDFWGFATRGAAGGGHAVWSVSTFIASWGADWLDAEGRPQADSEAVRDGLAAYRDLLAAVAPPDQPQISFVELMRDFRAGRVGMIMEVGMEYAHLFADDPAMADRAGVALVPAGPAGRFANLYAPPWAIPRASPVAEEAWQLATYLTSDRQLLEDGLRSNALETASDAVLYAPDFDRHFRPDLLAAVRANRQIAFEERPLGALGIGACEAVGNAAAALLEGRLDPAGASRAIQETLMGLAAEVEAR